MLDTYETGARLRRSNPEMPDAALANDRFILEQVRRAVRRRDALAIDQLRTGTSRQAGRTRSSRNRFVPAVEYLARTPVMLMLTGRLYDEGTMARIALAYEQATDWKDKHPTLA
jgi:hypothetical protein